MPKNKIILSALFVLLLNCAIAQSNIDSLRKVNKDAKIALKTLLGIWNSETSPGSKIEFVEEGQSVIIQPLLAGVSNYSFIKYDDSVSVNGYAPNWPPYDCILNLIDENTLEIKFFQYFYKETYNLMFTKK